MHKANADSPPGEWRLMHRMVIAGYGPGPSLSFRRHALQVEQPVASPRSLQHAPLSPAARVRRLPSKGLIQRKPRHRGESYPPT
jgi:hypothetical protein